MSELKASRASWDSLKDQDHCAVCLAECASRDEALMCDRIHYHLYCGARIVESYGRLTCMAGHPSETIVGYTAKTKEEATKDASRRW